MPFRKLPPGNPEWIGILEVSRKVLHKWLMDAFQHSENKTGGGGKAAGERSREQGCLLVQEGQDWCGTAISWNMLRICLARLLLHSRISMIPYRSLEQLKSLILDLR